MVQTVLPINPVSAGVPRLEKSGSSTYYPRTSIPAASASHFLKMLPLRDKEAPDEEEWKGDGRNTVKAEK